MKYPCYINLVRMATVGNRRKKFSLKNKSQIRK